MLSSVTSRSAPLLQDGQLIEEAHEGESVQIILDETPFYAESGGQIGDKGYLRSEQAVVRVKESAFV